MMPNVANQELRFILKLPPHPHPMARMLINLPTLVQVTTVCCLDYYNSTCPDLAREVLA